MNYATVELLKAKNSSTNPITVGYENKGLFIISDLENTFSTNVAIPNTELFETEDWGSASISINNKEYEVDYNIFVTKELITLILYPLKEYNEKIHGVIHYEVTIVNGNPVVTYLTDTSYSMKFQFENQENSNLKLVKDFIGE
jgi:hypothetical protein